MASWDELMPAENDPFYISSQQSRKSQSGHSSIPRSRSTVELPPCTSPVQDVTENIDITDSQLISRSRFQRSSDHLSSAFTKASQSTIFCNSHHQGCHTDYLPHLDNKQSQLTHLNLEFLDFSESQKNGKTTDNKNQSKIDAYQNEASQSSQHRIPRCQLQAPTSSHYRIPGSQLQLHPSQLQNSRSRHCRSPGYTPRIISQTPQPITFKRKQSGDGSDSQMVLRQVTELPEMYRHIFPFPYFNAVQSAVMNDALFSDKSLVVSAPTGSGKTAVFELAIIRLLSFGSLSNFKIVYMAPIKALCNERCQDWQTKFSPLDIKCAELTGDTEDEDCQQLHNASIILTTPEKWDSMSRKWRDNKSLVKLVKLFLIDEVHSVNDDTRGPTVEAVISRMKTVKATMFTSTCQNPMLRFVAVSATMPNIEDLSEWIGDSKSSAIYHKFDEAYRLVPLRKFVHGFFCNEKSSPYKFDLSLNYQLCKIIIQYANQKPTLVFCSTRKGTQTAADVLAKESYRWNFNPRHTLQNDATTLKDAKLRELVCRGVAYHHAGMDRDDREKIQNMFLEGKLPVLMATSTLAFGVNLPAHLVIIKSTQHYVSGQYTEYSETQVIQMMGRAGRPQFDTSATVVIMTRNQTKNKYECLTAGEKYLESSLHTCLIEHLNAEIVLHTINDTSIAMEWLKSTLLYVRIRKNPTHYGIQANASQDDIEKHLMGICVSDLNKLSSIGAISMDEEGFDIKTTDLGQLMARYCISFDTMKTFCYIKGDVSLEEMVTILSSCHEFSDIQLRMNERRILNTLNKNPNQITVRFPTTGKIKSTPLKVNCLIQATLGCLPIQEFSLQQDVMKIFRVGARVSKCLYELMQQRGNYKSLLNAALLSKCFKARLWENSRYVSRQIERIGSTLSTALVNAGVGSFSKLLETNPRQLELIVNRHPPFGNQIIDAVSHLPMYKVEVSQTNKHKSSSAEITVTICLENREKLLQKQTTKPYHCSLLLIGNGDDDIILKKKIMDTTLLNSVVWSRSLTLQRAKASNDININFISQDYVGFDVKQTLTLEYTNSRYTTNSKQDSQPKLQSYLKLSKPNNVSSVIKSISPASAEDMPLSPITTLEVTQDGRKACNHRCVNKSSCGHLCCRIGVVIKQPSKSKLEKRQLLFNNTSTPKKQKTMDAFLNQLHTRANHIPPAPQIKRKRVDLQEDKCLKKFTFKPRGSRVPSIYSKPSDSQVNNTVDIPSTEQFQTSYSSTSATKPRNSGLPHDIVKTTEDGAVYCEDQAQRSVASHTRELDSIDLPTKKKRPVKTILAKPSLNSTRKGLATEPAPPSHETTGHVSRAPGCPSTPARGWEHLDVYHLNRSKVPEPSNCEYLDDDDLFDLPEVKGICDSIIFQPDSNSPKPFRNLFLDTEQQTHRVMPAEEQPDSVMSMPSGQLVSCRNITSHKNVSSFSNDAASQEYYKLFPLEIVNTSFSDKDFYASKGSCEFADEPVKEKDQQAIHLPVNKLQHDTSTYENICVPEQQPIIICSSSEEDVYHYEESCYSEGDSVDNKLQDLQCIHMCHENLRNSVELHTENVSKLSEDFEFNQESECKVERFDGVRVNHDQPSKQQLPAQSFFGINQSMTKQEVDNAFDSIFDGIF